MDHFVVDTTILRASLPKIEAWILKCYVEALWRKEKNILVQFSIFILGLTC